MNLKTLNRPEIVRDWHKRILWILFLLLLVIGPFAYREIAIGQASRPFLPVLESVVRAASTTSRPVLIARDRGGGEGETPGLVVIHANNKMRALVGVERGEVVGSDFQRFMPRDYLPRHQAGLRKADIGTSGQVTGIDCTVIRADGESVPVSINITWATFNRRTIFVVEFTRWGEQEIPAAAALIQESDRGLE